MRNSLIALLIAIAGIPAIAAQQEECLQVGIAVSQITRIFRDSDDKEDQANYLQEINKLPKHQKGMIRALIVEVRKSDKSAVELSSNAISNCLKGY